ncbi:hypothetical protein N7481_004551 [Penicillium waksmanii]|uniref:uncharacterized protein n=1 Tax=Penicillium waksmanii TaxID=69791 RepID=UPI0025476FEF|nr:uncharacterized protein N7481_004551 [Penicillium waksmanii]KAJ5989341.1 hypothetical protein N7481_004551 [Penicillium waksmanii]
MATWAYPPLPPDRLNREADSALARELQWLLQSLQESLSSLKEGLQECAALLAPQEPGSTLVLSSVRSENVKGFVTRVGTKLVKGDVQLRLQSLPPPRGSPSTRLTLSQSPEAPDLVLQQLVSVRNLVNQSLDIVDVSTYTGDPHDAGFIFSQLHLLHETINEARQMLKGDGNVRGNWWETSVSDNVGSSLHPSIYGRLCLTLPPPPNLSFHLSIADSALILLVRTLESNTVAQAPSAFASDISLTGFSLRDRLFGSKQRAHDEAGDVFMWKGDEVHVREKIRVESQDPSLMSVMAKLTALEHEVMRWVGALRVLMGNDDTESEV